MGNRRGGNRRLPEDRVTDVPPSEDGLEPGVAFELLVDSRRRAAIEYFLDPDNPAPADFDCLAQFVFEEEYDPEGTLTKSRIRLSLHHVHLPKLDDAGVVEYDLDDRTVSYDGSELLERVLVAVADP